MTRARSEKLYIAALACLAIAWAAIHWGSAAFVLLQRQLDEVHMFEVDCKAAGGQVIRGYKGEGYCVPRVLTE